MLTAVDNIITSGTRFDKIAQMMERIKKGNKVKYDENVTMGNINSAFIDLFQAFKILEQIRSGYSCDSILNMLKLSVRNAFMTYQQMRKNENTQFTDYQPLLQGLAEMIQPISSDNRVTRLSPFHLDYNSHLSSWDYNTFSPTPDTVRDILSHLSVSREINYLDLNCHYGDQLLAVKSVLPKANLYGVTECDELTLSDDSRAKITRLVRGGLKQLKASNNVFDVVFVVPQLSLGTDQFDSLNRPKEVRYLTKAYDYLRKYGLMIYVTPIECITTRVATYISKNLRDVSIYYGMLGKDTVAIMGMKPDVFDRTLDPKTFTLLRNLIVNKKLLSEQKPLEYELPSTLLKVERFRGGILDEQEMNELFSESSAMKDFWKGQKVKKISDRSIHPLLPFNLGQLGLVLTSGCLDGVVDEGNGCSHAVKGRVVKVTDTNKKLSDSGDKVQVQKRMSNRVEISMFMPNGEYKCLI